MSMNFDIIASANSLKHEIKLYNFQSGKFLFTLQGHTKLITQVVKKL